MEQNLSVSAKRVQESLAEIGLTTRVTELSQSARTAQEAASALGCTVAQIVKSLVFKTTQTHKSVLILVSGVNRVNEKTIQAHVGEPIEKAEATFVKENTGFAIGGVPPIGHKTKIDYVFIDEDLLKHDSLWAAAGTPHAVFSFSSKDLVKLAEGAVISVQ